MLLIFLCILELQRTKSGKAQKKAAAQNAAIMLTSKCIMWMILR